MAIAAGNPIYCAGSFTGTPLSNGAVTTSVSGSTFGMFTYPATIGGSQTVTPSDNLGNVYTLTGTPQNDTADGISSGLYLCVNGVGSGIGGGHTPNISCDVHTNLQFYFFEITGGLITGILDQYFGNVGFLGNPSSAPVTTTTNRQLIMSYIACINIVTITPSGGFSTFANTGGFDAVMTRTTTSAGTYDPNASFSPSGGRVMVITASFIEAGSVATTLMGGMCL